MTNDVEKYPMTYVTTLVTMDSEGTEYDGNYIRAETIQNHIQECYQSSFCLIAGNLEMHPKYMSLQ